MTFIYGVNIRYQFLILSFRCVLYVICYLLGNSTASRRFGTLYQFHLPMKMELIEGSETSAISFVTPRNYPKENILHHKSILGSSLYYELERNTVQYNNKIMFIYYILPNIEILLLILREREYLGDPSLDGKILIR